MFYVFRSQPSTSARLLAEALEGRRIRSAAAIQHRLTLDDVVICWGEGTNTFPPGTRVINGGPIRSKLTDINTLREAGIATVQAQREQPRTEAAVDQDAMNAAYNTHLQHIVDQVDAAPEVIFDENGEMTTAGGRFGAALFELAENTPRTVIRAEGAPDGTWVGRSNAHHAGNDLIDPPDRPDYWVRREEIVNEYRVHSFDGRSIRAAVKVPRTAEEGFDGTPHEWIRSYPLGWRLSYRNQAVRQRHRDLAHAAVEALGLTFGAVDIGETTDGNLIVFEVNRAPGIEGGTIERYANAFRRLDEEEDAAE